MPFDSIMNQLATAARDGAGVTGGGSSGGVTGGGSAPAATGGGAGANLVQLMPADPSKGYSTPYYMAKTNSGDDAGAVMVGEGQGIRMIDPKTGQVLASGSGPSGAQQLVSLANNVSDDLGRKAQWMIQAENPDGQWTTQAFDRYDPKKTGLLGSIVRFAAPLLGAMIPGLAPMLGAALGGFGGNLATGNSFKGSLMAAAGAGLGNSLGGAFGNLATGSPMSFAGTNSIGNLANAAGVGGLGSHAAGSALGSVASALPGEVAPVIVTAGQQGLGGALGALAGSAGAGSLAGGINWDQLFKDPRLQNPSKDFANPQAGDDWASFAKMFPGMAPTTVDELTVTGGRPNPITPPMTGPYDVPGFTSTEMSPLNNSAFANEQRGVQVKDSGGFNPRQFGGEVLGGITGEMLPGSLLSLLGLMPKPDMRGVPDAGWDDATQPGPGSPPPMVGTGGGTPTAGGGVSTVNMGGGNTPAGGGTAGGGTAPASFGSGLASAAPSPAAAGADFDTQGALRPDIYPWRAAL